VDEAIYNFLYGDEDEKRRQFKEHFMIAAERAVREAIEAAAQVAEKYMHETGVLACKPPKSEAAWHIANEIRRTLLSP
jgi:hypothetical protein